MQRFRHNYNSTIIPFKRSECMSLSDMNFYLVLFTTVNHAWCCFTAPRIDCNVFSKTKNLCIMYRIYLVDLSLNRMVRCVRWMEFFRVKYSFLVYPMNLVAIRSVIVHLGVMISVSMFPSYEIDPHASYYYQNLSFFLSLSIFVVFFSSQKLFD